MTTFCISSKILPALTPTSSLKLPSVIIIIIIIIISIIISIIIIISATGHAIAPPPLAGRFKTKKGEVCRGSGTNVDHQC